MLVILDDELFIGYLSCKNSSVISRKRDKIERKLLLTACKKACTTYRLMPKCMTVNVL